MSVVMLLCALPATLFAPMTVFGALNLYPLAMILLSFGTVGVCLMVFYFLYSADSSHAAGRRRKVWFWWGSSICAHLSIIAFILWYVGNVEIVPFSPVTVMIGYLLLLTPVSVGMVICSGLILGIDFAAWRATARQILSEQDGTPEHH